MEHTKIELKDHKISISNNLPFALISGPCVLENFSLGVKIGKFLGKICVKLDIPFIFKASFDKANRTSANSYRGPGIQEGLTILAEIRKRINAPVLTDIHLPEQARQAAQVADILQIPAFLCRQTDLLNAAGETGKPVNVKKGQFLAPGDMANVISKIEAAGNKQTMLCERGTCFGYNNLVVDMRSLQIMKSTGCPVIFDATHSVQLPGASGAKSGGQREFAPTLARAAVAVGVAGIFIETHPDPDNASCDGPNMIPMRDMPDLLVMLKKIDVLVKSTGANQ